MGTYKGFDSVELRKPKRSTFNLSHERRLSTRMGKLTPVFMSETMPNDTFSCNSEIMLRLAPLLAPIMHRVNVFVHFFFVPNRLLWEDWETFITGGRLGEAVTTPPVPPRAEFDQILGLGLDLLDIKSLWDYLGGRPVPDTASATWGNRTFDLMPFCAYTKVWQDYYRDRNYVSDTDTPIPLPAGTNILNGVDAEILAMKYRCWEHDYFTSAQLTSQRGSEVLMPLEGTGSVTYLPASDVLLAGGGTPGAVNLQSDGAGKLTYPPGGLGRIENIDEVTLDASSVSINDLRAAVRLQEWLERNQLAGSRYNESIMAHFGRKTSDSRLQRAEYLGGGKVAVKISEVVTTAFSADADDNTVPAGNMAGHGLSFGNTNRFHYNCEEHGFVIGIMSVLPTSAYMQGIPRMFQNRDTFLSYPWPSFAHLGEQEVFDNEIFMDPTSTPIDRTTQPVFGYQSRYADWKFMQSSSHGDFRESLDFWHMTRKFTSQPALSSQFVTFNDELQDRIFAVEDVDTLWCYIFNNVSVKRSLPYFGTPTL